MAYGRPESRLSLWTTSERAFDAAPRYRFARVAQAIWAGARRLLVVRSESKTDDEEGYCSRRRSRRLVLRLANLRTPIGSN